MVKHVEKLLLLGIVLLAVFLRFWRLGVPDTYYFDEVYHAFTAKEMLLGNPAAWEFWNTPPVGFAYEWTHPPLAKLFMGLGMIVFGIGDPFGWRFFGAWAGVGIVVMVYLLALRLFKSQFTALSSAFLITLETLVFVESRIGMNDSYFLFFMLSSLLFLVNRRYFFAGTFWGLALASKWTAIYGVFIFAYFFIHEFFWKKKIDGSVLVRKLAVLPVYFIVIPLLIYLFSYTPFFFLSDPSVTDHIDARSKVVKVQRAICLPLFSDDFCNKLSIVWNVQQQMYWYHTRLEATHSYQSLWYTWPFDKRPVYYYVGNAGDKIAQIYALGNPAVFWAGIGAVGFAIYSLIKKPDFKLGFVLVSYLAFWLPWSLSPRIMFIYHYMPSIPFLVILIAVSLSRIIKTGYGRWPVIIYLLLVLITFVYFYPHVAAWPVSADFNENYFWFDSWR